MKVIKNIGLTAVLAASLLVLGCSDDGSGDPGSVPAINFAPVADAGVDQHIKTGALVTLDASASSDPDHGQLTYSWSITKPADSNATLSDATVSHPTFTADKDGNYVLELIVNDGKVDSAEATVTVTAATGNSTPVADAGTNQNVKTKSIHDAGIVFLDGSASSDADKNALTYSWSIQSRPTDSTATLLDATASHPVFIADKVGSYVVNLTVDDGTVESTVSTVTITASLNNSAPVANAGIDQHVDTHTQHNSGLVTLDANASTDSDYDTLTYSWSFQSIPENSNATLSNTNTSAPTFDADIDGAYIVKLIVNDGIVDSKADTVTVIANTTNSRPVADINRGWNLSVFTNQGDTTQLDASASADADGDTLTYTWHIKSQPETSTETLSSTTIENPTLLADVNGDYVVELTVNDGLVDSDPVEIRVTTKLTNETLKHLVKSYRLDSSDTTLESYIVNADTSNVTDMVQLFELFHTFNLDISGWTTSEVTNMQAMFFMNINSNRGTFNQNISIWDTSKVTNMSSMFYGISSFDQDISDWNVSAVIDHRNFDEWTSSNWEASEKPTFPTP